MRGFRGVDVRQPLWIGDSRIVLVSLEAQRTKPYRRSGILMPLVGSCAVPVRDSRLGAVEIRVGELCA